MSFVINLSYNSFPRSSHNSCYFSDVLIFLYYIVSECQYAIIYQQCFPSFLGFRTARYFG